MRTIFTGTLAAIAIQCKCPDTGKIGSFLFTGESHREKGSRVSPVMLDCGALFQWMRENSWELIGIRGRYDGPKQEFDTSK